MPAAEAQRSAPFAQGSADRNPSIDSPGAGYVGAMVYFLIGGPRSRQLVDELPRGYRAGATEDGEAGVVLSQDLVAEPAIWNEPVPQ